VGLLVGWKLPQCEAEWTLELPGAWTATLDPRGERIVVGTPKGLRVVDAQFGTDMGFLAADMGTGGLDSSICIRGDGTQAASWK